jgi:hypothetical protein
MQATSSGQKAFVWLYCMANFFQNFEPNTTTASLVRRTSFCSLVSTQTFPYY